MDCAQLMDLLKSINLPPGEWCVFGGACLAANDIRLAEDVDIFVTPKLYTKLSQHGWKEHVTNSTNSCYLQTVHKGIAVQAFTACGTSKWRPQVERYINAPEIISGMPFMPLKEMYAWKAATRRSKDLEDMAKIETYLHKSQV